MKSVKIILLLLTTKTMLISCTSNPLIVKHNENYNINEWRKRKAAILPVIGQQSNNFTNIQFNEMFKRQLKKNHQILQYIHYDIIAKKIKNNSLSQIYNKINSNCFTNEEIFIKNIYILGKKLNYDILIVPIMKKDSHKVRTNWSYELEYTYKAQIHLLFYNVKLNKFIFTFNYKGYSEDTVATPYSIKKLKEEIKESEEEGNYVKAVMLRNYAPDNSNDASYEKAYRNCINECLEVILDLFEGECIDGNCNNGEGTFLFFKNALYKGQWKNGCAHGKGTLYRKKPKILHYNLRHSKRPFYNRQLPVLSPDEKLKYIEQLQQKKYIYQKGSWEKGKFKK